MNQLQAGSGPRLSAETIHASTVANDGRAVLITGPSGSGKSDLALRLLDRGFALVSDDQTMVKRDGDRLLATAPPNIAGKLEIRGIGIVEMEPVERRARRAPRRADQRHPAAPRRQPGAADPRGQSAPGLDRRDDCFAPSKVALALDRMGLKF